MRRSKDTDLFKEEKETEQVFMVVFFLLGAITGYVLAHLR